ncbi:unnamed protein product [Lactuca saligna]|uniref:Ubiquitin-like domain-containing protein n=1 Tax=Lactuca saligna TaxID=75948 RepID=A0AA35YLR6_LACSI|nr:unnamed protein product [Lactuca saligna]
MTRAIMSSAHTKDQSFGVIQVFLGLQVHEMLSQMNPTLVPVLALKEHIASVTVVLSEQQRLIYRGKVLKDDQLLSAYLLHGKVVHKVGVVSIGVGGLKLTEYLKEQLRLRDLHVSSLYTVRSLKEAVADSTKCCYVAKMRTDHTWFRTVVLAGGTGCLPGLPDIQVDDENIVP